MSFILNRPFKYEFQMSTYWKIKFKELIKFAEKYAYKFTLTSL